jgi:branched-chain amino acid transport system permease protein
MLRRSSARRLVLARKDDRLAQYGMMVRLGLPLGAVLAIACVGCARPEVGRARICEQALVALEPGVQTLGHQARLGDTIVVRYRKAGADLELVCRFAPRGLESDGLELTAVTTAQEGPLSPSVLFLLKVYGLGLSGDPARARLPAWVYLAQQLANALAPSAIYALLAAGYAVIYGITGRINLAFGEFLAVGAFAALAGILAGSTAGGSVLTLALAGVFLAGITGAALGAALYGLVFAPLRQRGSQALLIATIGLAITIAEALRLLANSRQSWLQPFFTSPLQLGRVVVSPSQIGLAAMAAATVGTLGVVLRRSAFGRAYRACADDPIAAALMGVDIDRTLRQACVLGSALAALAGFVVAVHYGVVSFSMGTLLGLKALTAAVIGGIGSVPGAALGGVLIGMFESLWSGYLPSAYREVAMFALLALMLALRPDGLFGQPPPIANPIRSAGPAILS